MSKLSDKLALVVDPLMRAINRKADAAANDAADARYYADQAVTLAGGASDNVEQLEARVAALEKALAEKAE